MTHSFESVQQSSPVIQNNLLNMESNNNPSMEKFFRFHGMCTWSRTYELEGLLLISSVSVEVL